MDAGSPVRSETVGDFAKDDGGADFPSVGHEDEELVTPRLDLLLQDPSIRMGCGYADQLVELALCLSEILFQCRVPECVSPSADTDCPA